MEEDQLEAIDTGEGNESAGLSMTPRPSTPPMQEDNSGAAPVADAGDWQKEAPGAIDTGEEKGYGTSNGPIAKGLKAFPGNAKRIISYLMGADAAPPQAVQAMGQQVDPQGQLPASDRNLAAVQKVAEENGPEAAWKLVQANRVAYNAKQAFAYAALNGTQQKRPDIAAAVDAANQAQEHVLDGSDVKFSLSQGGVTATVRGQGGQPQQIQLSPQAFREYLNVGRTGQYDRLMRDTVPATLQKLAAPRQQSRIPATTPRQPTQLEDTSGTGPVDDKTNFGTTPSTMNLSGSDQVRRGGKTAQEETNYGDELEARAQRMFPSASQERERNQWMAQEEQRQAGLQNKLDVEETKGKFGVQKEGVKGDAKVDAEHARGENAVKVADIKTQGWKYASDAKTAAAQIKADQQKAHDGDKAAQARIETARKAIGTKRMTAEPLTAEEKQLEQMMAAGGRAAMSGQAPQAPAAPQAAAPQKASAPPAAQRQVGQTVTTAKGTFKWNGSGWEPQ